MQQNQAQQMQVFSDWLLRLRATIVTALQKLDGAAVVSEDQWSSPLGKGDSSLITGGVVLEKGGINYSKVAGASLPAAATDKRPQLAGLPFAACGLSLVLHPENPYVPITHANFRLFQVGGAEPLWWFGGGFDLTPCYGFAEDARHWHRTAQAACAPFGDELYPRFKKGCDEYFYLPHRREMRGIGGLFFDDINEGGYDNCFALVRSIGEHFLPAWLPIAERRKDTPYGEGQKQFQLYRRGRYVEFNLVYDRGTAFGLQSGGRAESILMSLPPLARWEYCWQPEPASPEAGLVQDFLQPRDWLA